MDKKSTAIALPAIPKGMFHEHLAFGCFHALGKYVEHNIIEREEKQEILELDAIATDFSSNGPKSELIECKSGDYGFSDLFKMVGWMRYLNIEQGTLMVSAPLGPEKNDIYKRRAKDLGVGVVVAEKSEDTAGAFGGLYPGAVIIPQDLTAWRYSYWIERKLLDRLRNQYKSNSKVKRYGELQKYHDQVNNSIFFTTNLLERIADLYSAFFSHTKITARCAMEMIGGKFDVDEPTIPGALFNKTFYESDYNDLQISCYIDQRARLAILKNAIEYKLLERQGLKDDRTSRAAKFLGFDIDRYNLLPKHLRSGLDAIMQHPFVHRYPVFWQWFSYVFGGFILLEKKDQEYKLLSEKTGVPVAEIENAFSSYAALFPSEREWFEDGEYSSIRRMIFNSGPFEGIGSFYRLINYAPDGDFSRIGLSAIFATKDLMRWNDLAYQVLRK
jgi:hypothetical protein